MSNPSKNDYPPLVVHIIQRLAVGGLENGLVNLINHMPEELYRHVIVCLADSTDFAQRIQKPNVPVIALHQRRGQDFAVHGRLLRLFLSLRPDIVHTRNLSGLEFQVTATLAGICGRVHGEHGRDMHDLDGASVKYNLLRKAMRPFIKQYTAVSIDLARWLMETVGVHRDRVTQIYNGVDVKKFSPRQNGSKPGALEGFDLSDKFVIGTVGRLEAVKDQLTLTRAFIHLVNSSRDARNKMRLIIVGDGTLRQQVTELLRNANVANLAWMAGERQDVPALMKAMDVFVLPSLREGISNTILEAMATGLPVVATNVGGNPELLSCGETGEIVPHSNPLALAKAIDNYFSRPDKTLNHGWNGRRRVEQQFSMEAMVQAYLRTYDKVLGGPKALL